MKTHGWMKQRFIDPNQPSASAIHTLRLRSEERQWPACIRQPQVRTHPQESIRMMKKKCAAVREPSNSYVWYVVGLLAVVNAFNYVDRMALSVLLPFIKEDLQLSDGELGLLVGFAFSLFYAICGVPLARWGDRAVRVYIIALAIAVWSVMTVLSGAAKNFWHLFAARIGVGIGEAGCSPPAQSLICDYVPLARRPGAFAIQNFGGITGMMIGMALAGWLGETIGWRWTFVVLGLPGLALAIVVRLTLREPVRGSLDFIKVETNALPIGETLCVLWSRTTYRCIVLLYVVNGFVQYGLHQWWPSFYIRTFGLSPSSVGAYLGTAIGVGGGIGLLIGGVLANKAANRDVKLPMMLGCIATVLAIPSAWGTLFASSASISILLVATSALCWNISTGAVVTALTSIVDARMRGTAAAITVLFAAVLGFGFGPFCVGVLSDLLTPALGVEALRYALLLPIALLPLLALLFYIAARSLTEDMRAAGSRV
jgi:predicted MFS family arabinose efflux permease